MNHVVKSKARDPVDLCEAFTRFGVFVVRKPPTHLFDDAERAAFALTEAMTRLADHPDAVTDAIWAEAAEYFDEPGLSALVSMVALTNFFNRVNTTLRVQPGSWD